MLCIMSFLRDYQIFGGRDVKKGKKKRRKIIMKNEGIIHAIHTIILYTIICYILLYTIYYYIPHTIIRGVDQSRPRPRNVLSGLRCSGPVINISHP